MERIVRFSWDEDKNTINKGKHGVSFEAAQYVFDDPFFVAVQDRFVEGEERWQTTGMVAGVTLLLVAHTWIDDGQEERIRIISARLANRKERQNYERNT